MHFSWITSLTCGNSELVASATPRMTQVEGIDLACHPGNRSVLTRRATRCMTKTVSNHTSVSDIRLATGCARNCPSCGVTGRGR